MKVKELLDIGHYCGFDTLSYTYSYYVRHNPYSLTGADMDELVNDLRKYSFIDADGFIIPLTITDALSIMSKKDNVEYTFKELE